MKFYVATSMHNKSAARAAMDLIEASGHEVTHDWTWEDASSFTQGTPVFEAYLEHCGRQDLRGVQKADAVIVLAHPEMRDTRAELGIALGMGKPVFIVEPGKTHSVFYFACIRVPSVVHALSLLELQRNTERPSL